MRRIGGRCLLGVVVALAGGWGMAQEIVLPVVEDTWIDGLSSTGPRGNDLALAICPVANYWIYVKFDLTEVPGAVTGAELRLQRFNGSRPEEISVYGILDDSWSEASLTGVNRPEPTSPSPASSVATGEALADYDRWSSGALTGLVEDERQGDGTLTLMLREDPGQMIDIRYYRSQEAVVPTEDKPRLVVTCGTAPVTDVTALAAIKGRFGWTDAGSGTVWDVVGGRLTDLRSEGGVQSATCLVDDLALPEFEDSRPEPLPGEGDYILVRAVGPCGAGNWGVGAGGALRIPLAACP